MSAWVARRSRLRYGIDENLPTLVNYRVADGRFFTAPDVEQHRKVCVIGQVVKRKLFAGLDPIGETVRIGGRASPS